MYEVFLTRRRLMQGAGVVAIAVSLPRLARAQAGEALRGH